MKIKVLCISKTTEAYIQIGMDDFLKRLKHFIKIEWVELPDVKNRKNLSKERLLKSEADLFSKNLKSNDRVILLDEKGKEYSSRQFSQYLDKQMMSGGDVVFLIGGPYGFSEEIYQRANGKLALSKMTFTHQMVRLFFLEQLYRGFAILKNLPYHHD